MKRVLAAIGLLAMPLSASASFPDVPAAYEHRRPIEYLQSIGVLRGYEDGNFRPSGTINRAELLKILVTGKGVEPDVGFYASCFPDVTDQWFAPYVCYAQLAGWVDGYPDGTFGPERPVTFAEAVKMLVNVRGYPAAPTEEIVRRGMDPATWFSSYLTTALLIDVVSYDQVWGQKATPLQQPLRRGFVAQLLYRSLLTEGLTSVPLDTSGCATAPSSIEIKTFVDVLMPSKTNVFRQDVRGIDAMGKTCLLVSDANAFSRVALPFDQYFLQPYPGGQPKDSWTARVPLVAGRAILRGSNVAGAGFRPEVFVIDVPEGVMRQLPSIFAGVGGTAQSDDGRYIVFVGSSGYTLEVVDLVAGTHALIDAVQPPYTFVRSKKSQVPAMLSSQNGGLIVTYSLYDESSTVNGENAFLETRTADIAAILSPELLVDPFSMTPGAGIETLVDPFLMPSGTGAQTVIDPQAFPSPMFP